MGNGDMMKVMKLIQQDNGIAQLLQEPVYDLTDGEPQAATTSQADIVADIINVMRLDIYRIAQEEGVDIDIKRITPEVTAAMLQGLVKGEGLDLIEKFNEIEDQHEAVIEEIADEETLEKHRALKQEHLFSTQEVEGDTPLDNVDTDGESLDSVLDPKGSTAEDGGVDEGE